MIDLRTVDHLFELGAGGATRHASIKHGLFRDFSISINRLLNTLGDGAEEELWKRLLAPIKRYRFSLAGAPVPFNSEFLSIATLIEAARGRFSFYERAHLAAAKQLEIVLDLGVALQTCSDNPMRDFIAEQFPKGVTDGAVLLKDSRLIMQAQWCLRQHPATCMWPIVTAGQLKKETCYAHLLILGAARWFPEYVITAPRAPDTCVVRYSWIRDTMPNRRVFDHGPNPGDSNAKSVAIPYDPVEMLDAQDVVPQIDWAAIKQRALTNVEASFDDVPAKIAVIEGDFAVLLEDDEFATILTLELDTDEPTERVRRIPVHRIVPGMFIILRTTGGGDYILPIADKILGKTATYVRSCQREWKAQLRRAVAQSSLLEVSVRLLDAGSIRANEMNVRNWMSPRNIRTDDPKDFAAIMKVIGLERSTDEYWNAMAAIRQAHQRAGQQIRRVLLRQLQAVDLAILERDGRLEISLPDVDAGTLTAFRVIDLAPADQLVSSTKLNHPFPLGDTDAPHAPR
jgi:hypothetical protein